MLLVRCQGDPGSGSGTPVPRECPDVSMRKFRGKCISPTTKFETMGCVWGKKRCISQTGEASNEEMSFFDWIDHINDVWARSNHWYYFFLKKYTELTLFTNGFHQRYVISIIGGLYAIIVFFPLSGIEGSYKDLPPPTCDSTSCRTLIQIGTCSGTTCAYDLPCNISYALTRNDMVCYYNGSYTMDPFITPIFMGPTFYYRSWPLYPDCWDCSLFRVLGYSMKYDDKRND